MEKGVGMRTFTTVMIAVGVLIALTPAGSMQAQASIVPPHTDWTNYAPLNDLVDGLLTVDGHNPCSFRVTAPWPSWCHDRWVMADDVDSRADIRAFAAAAALHNARVVWAPGYISLDGYASRFGGVVVIQAERLECHPAVYADAVRAAVAAIAGRTPTLAEIIYGPDTPQHLNCTATAKRSWRRVRPIVTGYFLLDFRAAP
jgi:hypothetical protein